MRNKELFDDVMNQLKCLEPKNIMHLNNQIADDLQFDIMRVFDNHDEEKVNEIFREMTPVDVLRMAQATGDYNIAHDFARFDGYGDLISSRNICNLVFNYELIADWLIRHSKKAKKFGIRIAIANN